MRKYLIISSSLLIISGFISCKKSGNQPDKTKEVDVYITGFTRNETQAKAAYWKNGILTSLASTNEQSSEATDIEVQGSDVYVAGSRGINNKSQACFWKNGIRHDLQDNNFASWAIAIAVKGTDVYVVGLINNTSTNQIQSVCWKNGLQTNLITKAPVYWQVEDILVMGEDIYMSGVKLGDLNRAVYCKNGVVTELPLTDATVFSSSVAGGMASDGKNVYIAGHQNSANGPVAVYWKNGTPIKINNSSWAFDVDVQNNDVYLVGEKVEGYIYTAHPKVWKNGVEHINFSTQYSTYRASKIAVSQGDIYTIGMEGSDIPFNTKFSLFKNGVRETFSNVSAIPTNVKIVNN